jgi:hypothetical protein
MSIGGSQIFNITIPESYVANISNFQMKEKEKDPMKTVFSTGGGMYGPVFNGKTYEQIVQDYFFDVDTLSKVGSQNPPTDQQSKDAAERKKILDGLMKWNMTTGKSKVKTDEGNCYHAQVTIHAFMTKLSEANPYIPNAFPILATKLEGSKAETKEAKNAAFVKNIIPQLATPTDPIEMYVNTPVKDGKHKDIKYITLYNNPVEMEKIAKVFRKRERSDNSNVIGHIEHFYYWSIPYKIFCAPIEATVIIEGKYKDMTYDELYQDVDACEELELEYTANQNAAKGSIPHFVYYLSTVPPEQPVDVNDTILVEGEYKGKKYRDVYEIKDYHDYLEQTYTHNQNATVGTLEHYFYYTNVRNESKS